MSRISCTLLKQFESAKVFQLESALTFYSAAIADSEVRLFGPGVDETYLIDEDIPDSLSDEGKAMMAVLLWEESET